MKIRSLTNTPLATLIDCLLVAFEGYFVKMPSDLTYWDSRFKGARVDFDLSYGAFEGEQLVAFIINGIDVSKGVLTAFNTGTGVIPAFRGQGLVDKLYDHAIPLLKNKGVHQCSLEVIQTNKRAIWVYERIGFKIKRSLKCFKGTINKEPSENEHNKQVSLQNIPFTAIAEQGQPRHDWYSWDHSNEAILKSGDVYQTYLVNRGKKIIGYFAIQESGYLGQFEASDADFPYLITAIKTLHPTIKINNVDASRTALVNNLLAAGLENTIDQFEMVKAI